MINAAIIATFLWIGFIGAISFMEAWLKFRAEGVTISIGLGIGQLVFGALNKTELIFAAIIIFTLIYIKAKVFKIENLAFAIPVVLLILQTFWLLPSLDERAELIIKGQTVAASSLHFFYIAMEIIKVVCLFIFGLVLLKKTRVKE